MVFHLFAISQLRNATSFSQNCDFFFWSKVEKKIVMSTFTPPPKVVETWKSFHRGSFFKADTPVVSKNSQLPQNRQFSNFRLFRDRKKSEKHIRKKKFGVETWNVPSSLKRVLAKFQAERSHPRGVNGREKFCKNFRDLARSRSGGGPGAPWAPPGSVPLVRFYPVGKY